MTIFVDHASGNIFSYYQKNTGAEETLAAKQAFEHMSHQQGVKILQYHADNGKFRLKAFIDAFKKEGQSLSFSAVGSHHQNGISERNIRTLSDCARTMLIHAAHNCPEKVKYDLWPFAMKYDMDIYNRRNRERGKGKTPDEIFTQTNSVKPPLIRFHTFGCPVFVLDSNLQDNNKIPR